MLQRAVHVFPGGMIGLEGWESASVVRRSQDRGPLRREGGGRDWSVPTNREKRWRLLGRLEATAPSLLVWNSSPYLFSDESSTRSLLISLTCFSRAFIEDRWDEAESELGIETDIGFFAFGCGHILSWTGILR